jgi:prevent-host-death family protein
MKTTRSAGVRDTKARLSEMLRDVQAGHEWIITERGKPVARLVPPKAQRDSLEVRLKRLEAAGIIERRTAPRLPLPLPLADGLAQRMLADDRGV